MKSGIALGETPRNNLSQSDIWVKKGILDIFLSICYRVY